MTRFARRWGSGISTLIAVNEGQPGAYKYFPDTGIMQFPSGDYSSMFARYSPDSKGFDVFSAVNDGILEYGDYGWTCNA